MNKLMMKLTIGSEAVFFLSLMLAYVYFWQSGNFETKAVEHLSIKSTGFFHCCYSAAALLSGVGKKILKEEIAAG